MPFVFWRETPHEHVLNQTLFLSLTVAPLRNVVSFNVNGFNIEKKERLSSAKLRVMVEIASHVPSLPLRGDIVLYDQFSHEAIQSVAFRGSGTRCMGDVFCSFHGTEMAFLTASQLWCFREGEVV